VLAHHSLPIKCTPWFPSIIEPYHGDFTNVCHFAPLSAHISFISSKYPTWCRSTFQPCRYELTHNIMYPSYLVYPREFHLYSCQSSFLFWCLTPMEPVSINVKLHKGFLRLEHLMKLSDNGDRVINATGSESSKCSVATHRRKKWHGWLRSLPLFNCPAILLDTRSMCLSSFLVPPPS
jgi:hypothetical protein